jgi:hypothetical protein
MTLSAYEQKEWDRLQKRKADALGKQARQLIPQQARERLAALGEKAKNVPGADKVTAAYNGAARGVGKAVGDTASRTVSKKRVIAQYQRAGHEINELDEIRNLDLRVVDAVAKQNLVRYGHALSAAATGLTSGAVVTGGELLAGVGSVAGAGVAAAPGIGTVAGAMAADATLMLGLSTRTVSSTALCYGYDPRDPEEEVFVMSVIALGLSAGTSAKVAAYAELSQLTQMLVRNVPWTKLNEKVLVKIAQRFAEKFGHHLVKRKLGQFVPVAGMVVGAGLSYKLIDHIAVAARDAYRERFLVEKSGGDLTVDLDFDEARGAEDDHEFRVIRLLREEDALPTSSPSSDDEDEPLD